MSPLQREGHLKDGKRSKKDAGLISFLETIKKLEEHGGYEIEDPDPDKEIEPEIDKGDRIIHEATKSSIAIIVVSLFVNVILLGMTVPDDIEKTLLLIIGILMRHYFP